MNQDQSIPLQNNQSQTQAPKCTDSNRTRHSVGQSAVILGVTFNRMLQLIRSGKVDADRKGGRYVVGEEELQRYLLRMVRHTTRRRNHF